MFQGFLITTCGTMSANTSTTSLYRPNPYDGFRPKVFERENANPLLSQIEVYVELVGGGEAREDILLAAFPLNDSGRAMVAQFNPLLHALCMLADTGASVGILQSLVGNFIRVMEKYRIEIPEGYRLANLDYTFDIPKKYVFVRDTDGEEVHVSPDLEIQVLNGIVASGSSDGDVASVSAAGTKAKKTTPGGPRSKVLRGSKNKPKGKTSARSAGKRAKVPTRGRR